MEPTYDANIGYDSNVLYEAGANLFFDSEVKYRIVIRDFADTTTYGKGTVALIVENVHNLAWTEYANDVGEAFFTMSQEDPKIADIVSLVEIGAHMEVYRNDVLVWGGWLGEIDETFDDVIIYGYNYVSGLYTLLTDWDQSWTNEGVHTIFSDLWTRAKTLGNSRMGWMTHLGFEQLVTTSGGSTTLTMPLYKVYRKRILSAMKELAAYAISDTTNRVSFEVNPGGRFALFADRGTSRSDMRWRVGSGGKIRSFRRVRMPVDRRTDLYAVGSSPTDVLLQHTASNSSLRTSKGRAEEPIFLQWVRDQDELERVTKIRLAKAGRVDTDLMVTFYPDSITPYRAPNSDYDMLDQLSFRIDRGISSSTDTKIVVGQQVIYSRKSENVRVLLADRL